MDSISPEIELCPVRNEHEAHMSTHSMKQNNTPHAKPIQSFAPEDQLGGANEEEPYTKTQDSRLGQE